MNLYLMRHAHAVSETENPDRPLSEKGRNQVRVIGRFLNQNIDLDVSKIWHSPLLRSVETADILADTMELSAPRRSIDGLLPYDDVRGIARRLAGYGHALLVVGHEPHLGRLVSVLTSGTVDLELVDFRKGAIVCLERVKTRALAQLWQIKWLLPPGLLMQASGRGDTGP